MSEHQQQIPFHLSSVWRKMEMKNAESSTFYLIQWYTFEVEIEKREANVFIRKYIIQIEGRALAAYHFVRLIIYVHALHSASAAQSDGICCSAVKMFRLRKMHGFLKIKCTAIVCHLLAVKSVCEWGCFSSCSR